MMKKAESLPKTAELGFQQVVDITNPTYQSLQGKYFTGQTGLLGDDPGFNSWAMLKNPENSGVNLFFDLLTLSNYSADPYVAYTYFNSIPSGTELVSVDVASGNTALSPLPIPKSQIKYSRRVSNSPEGGVIAFDRVVGGFFTEKSEFVGRFIFGPGGALIVYLIPLKPATALFSRVAFGWWEEEITTNN